MNIKEHYRAILTEQLQVAATYGNNIDIDEIVDTLLADSRSSVGLDAFPKQGAWLGRQVDVCFDYALSRTVRGRIVREDAEHPGRMIIALDDGRHVLSTECQYSLLPAALAQPQEGVVPDGLQDAVAEVLRQAFYLLDDTANDNPPEVPQDSWDNLSNAVTALEALIPDSEQPCNIGVAARLLAAAPKEAK